jgi:peptidoglycan lytic transglycosylase G
LLAELWADRAEGLPVKTPEEAVILASIVEKETGLAEERPRVAAVFVNRLRKHMRLQSDPTIIYGITEGKSRLDRPLRRSDIAEKTPYNTYQVDGLPPTPIANPGREALAAVLNPMDTSEIYFVADGTGGHVFAATLKDHQANVKRWRQVERDQRDAEAAADQAPATADNATETVPDEAQKPAAEADLPATEKASEPAVAKAAEPVTAPLPIPDEPAEATKAEEPVTAPLPIPDEPAAAIKAEEAAKAEATKVEAPVAAEIATSANDKAPAAPIAQLPMPKPTPPNPPVTEVATIEPGQLVKVAGRLVPVPRPRPPR